MLMASTATNARHSQDVPKAVIAAAQAGDEAAYETIYIAYYARIRNYIYRMMGSPEDASDLTQDTFVKAWRALPGTSTDLRVGAWLYRIATNVCLDQLRHRKLIKWQPLADDTRQHDTVETQYIRQAQAIERQSILSPLFPQPERAAEQAEQRQDVRTVLARLHEPYRQMLVLREYAGLTYDEAADVLGTTRSAVKSRVSRARTEFRARWNGTLRVGTDKRLSHRAALRRTHAPIIEALCHVIEESSRTSWRTRDLTAAVLARGVILPEARPSLVVGGLLKRLPALQYDRASRVWLVV